MPGVHFTVQLADGAIKDCYSPSTIVRDYFAEGDEMPVTEFVTRSREALAAASERVRAKFGFGCTSAAAQLAEIERWTSACPVDSTVRILHM